jgi:putative oxidoreductase
MSDMTTQNLALLVLRAAIGSILLAHGYNKAFGVGGLDGTARWFASLGLRPPALHARVAAFTELAAGTALALGLITSAACAATIGLMTVAAITDHRGKGFFVFKGGWEYVAAVGVVSAVVAAVGPGTWSLDNAFGWTAFGWAWSLVAILLGVVAAVGLVVVCRRPVASARGHHTRQQR